MTDTLRDQVARVIDPYPWHQGFDDDLFAGDTPIAGMRDRSLQLADAVLAVATPLIRAQVIEELAQKAHAEELCLVSWYQTPGTWIPQEGDDLDYWLRSQIDEPDERKIYIGFRQKDKDRD